MVNVGDIYNVICLTDEAGHVKGEVWDSVQVVALLSHGTHNLIICIRESAEYQGDACYRACVFDQNGLSIDSLGPILQMDFKKEYSLTGEYLFTTFNSERAST